MSFGEHLLALMAAKKVDQSELARRIGISSQAVNQWLNARTGPRNQKRLQEIARALEIPLRDLLSDADRAPPSDPDSVPPNARIATAAPPLPAIASFPRDVPVFGTAQGGPEGVFGLNMADGPIDWARRPPPLQGMTQVFAIYVEGESMAPWRQPGELVYVHKTRPAAPGCHVVVVEQSTEQGQPPRAYIKRLVRRTATKLELQQYNPVKSLTLDMRKVSEVLRVMEWPEVMGI